MTLSVKYGERFEIMEAVDPADISIKSDKWVLVRVGTEFVAWFFTVNNLFLAKSLDNPQPSEQFMRVPLKCVALEGSLESQVK